MATSPARYLVAIAAESDAASAGDSAASPLLLGGKGAGLVGMCRLGLPVPPGVIVTTALYRRLAATGRDELRLDDELWAELWAELAPALTAVVAQRRAHLQHEGDAAVPPTLWAVRSGAPTSMPGMLDSILNVGLNAQTVAELGRWSGSSRFAADCHRRFLRQYAQSVLGLPLLQRQRLGSSQQRADLGADADELRFECAALKDEIRQRSGQPVPDEPAAQLRAAIEAVLRSFGAPRARDYRRLTGQPSHLAEQGTAVIIQVMVFGNRSEQSGTGVVFSRNPSTGEALPYGEFLPCAQGEDVVSGTAMPQPLSELSRRQPTVYAELCAAVKRLERATGDLQDVEFTVEEGRLWLLQARSGKRSGRAMVRIAAELCREGQLTPTAALARLEPRRLAELLYPTVDPAAAKSLLGRGLPASPGVAIGRVAFTVADVEAHAAAGTPAILVRTDTSPDDIRGIQLAAGVLTARGGMTSHAAVVARGLGRCAVVGASALSVDQAGQRLSSREHTVRRGELLTIDGNSGEVLLGAMPLLTSHLAENRDLLELLRFAKARRLQIFALADSVSDWQLAGQLLAEGVGLFRTESLLVGREALLDEAGLQPLTSMLGPSATDRSQLVALLSAAFAERLALLPGLPTCLRLFDPLAAHRLAALTGGAAATVLADLAPTATWTLWEAQLEALLVAMAQLAGRGLAARPQLLLPLGEGRTGQAAALLARLRQLLSRGPSDGSAASGLTLGVQVDSPADLAVASALGDGELLLLTLPSLGALRPVLTEAVRAAKLERPGLRLGLALLDGGSALGDPAQLGWLDGLGLEFVACPPLRMAVASVAAAQAQASPAAVL